MLTVWFCTVREKFRGTCTAKGAESNVLSAAAGGNTALGLGSFCLRLKVEQ